jgi:hypothetical protein
MNVYGAGKFAKGQGIPAQSRRGQGGLPSPSPRLLLPPGTGKYGTRRGKEEEQTDKGFFHDILLT